VAALIVGVVSPVIIDGVVEETLEDNTYLTPGSEALENQMEPPKRGLAGVRVTDVASLDLDADEYEDGGVRYIFHVSNITNPEAVLYDGARPVQRDVAFAFRKYTKYENFTHSEDDSSLTWDSQSEYIYVDDPARLDEEVLVIPNVGFAGFGALLPTLVGAARGVDALNTQAVSLRGNDRIGIDDIAVPIFVSQFLREGTAALTLLLKAFTLPAVIPTRHAAARAANSLDNSPASMMQFATVQVGGTVSGVAPDTVTQLQPLPGVTVNMEAAVYLDLMNPGSTTGFALISTTGLARWLGLVNLFADVDTSNIQAVLAKTADPAFVQFNAGFAAAYQATDSTYSDPTAATGHILQVLLMAAALTGSDSSTAGMETLNTFNQIVGSFSQASVALPSVTDEGLFAAQMGSNTVLGVLAAAGNALPPNVTVNMAAGSAVADGNTCLAGQASIFTALGQPSVLNSLAEFSCVAGAPPTLYSRRAHPAANGLIYAGSRLPGSMAAALLAEFSSSPALFNEASALLQGALPDFGAGSEAIWRFRAVYMKQVASNAAIKAMIDAQVGLHAAYIAALATGGDVVAAATASGVGYGTSLAAQAALHAQCASFVVADVDSSITGMDCFQVHDVYHWIEHTSNGLVYFPNLVETFYGTQNTPATTPGRSAGNMATGPFIKATPRMLLFDGFTDSILASLQAGAVPPLVSNASIGTRETIGTGAGGRDEFWRIEQVRGKSEVRDWQGTVAAPSPIEGSYDGLRHPFGEELDESTADDLPLTMQVWVAQAERFVVLHKAIDENNEQMDPVKGPNGKLEGLQRYTIQTANNARAAYGDDAEETFVRYNNDVLYNTPEGCMISIRAHPEYVSAQTLALATGEEADSTTEFDLFLTQPSNLACNATIRALSSDYGEATQELHGSFIDVDPVSGRALNAARRLAGVIRLRPFPTYPRLAEGTGGEQVYMQIQWVEEGGTATPGTEEDIKDLYDGIEALR